MKIVLNAHLLSATAGYRTAGVHGYMVNLLRCLPAVLPADWQLTALVGAGNPLTFDGITMRPSRWNTESPARRIVWEQLAQPFALGGYDLYHGLAFVSPLASRMPSVITVYDLSFIHFPGVHSPARRLYLRLFTHISCQRARRVIGISRSTALDVRRTLGIPADKIDIASGAYAAELYRPLPAEQVAAFRQQQGLPERFWLFVGTLEPRKNLPTLLRAYAALSPSERLPLVVGGAKGWDYDAIFAVVEQYNLADLVKFVGFIPTDALPLWYNSAEVFLYPSVFEGFGLPPLEAMGCGTPVIVSDATSLPEVVGEAGLTLPPHDIAAWTAALRTAFHDADWRAQARALGLQQAAQFSWQETARCTAASYQKALGIA